MQAIIIQLEVLLSTHPSLMGKAIQTCQNGGQQSQPKIDIGVFILGLRYLFHNNDKTLPTGRIREATAEATAGEVGPFVER